MIRILVTGQRDWPDAGLVETALLGAVAGFGVANEDVTIVHGGCPTGADQFTSILCAKYGWREEVHHAQWNQYGRAAGPKRNQEMVDSIITFALAFIGPGSRGTADCLKRIVKARIPHKVFQRSQCQSS